MRFLHSVFFALSCLWAGGVLHAQEGDPYHAQLFATVDRSVVAVGEEMVYTVELLAVPETSEAEEELRSAFLAAEPRGKGFAVTRTEAIEASEVEGVLELKREFRLRSLLDSTIVVGPVILDVSPQSNVRTPTFEVVGYRRSPRLDAVGRSVVSLEAHLHGGARRIGSGFVADADAVATAYHVIAGARRVDARFSNGHRVRIKEIIALDPERDVALLHVPPEAIRRGDASPLPRAPVGAGTRVAFTAGWPDQRQVGTAGTRYANVEIETGTVWVSDNPVEPGDSGGPLFDRVGRVLGVVVSGRPAPDAPNVLQETVAIASDPRPAIRSRWEHPQPLRKALRDAADAWPSARALEAVTEVQVRREAVSEKLDDLSRLSVASEAAPLIQYLGGSVLEAAGREQPARRAFSRAEAYFPAKYSLAHHFLEAGEYDRAVSLFEALYDAQPYRHLGAFGLVRARISQRRYGEARAALDVVLAHDPHFVPALYLRGLLFVESDEPVKAAALAARLRSHPEWSDRLRLAIQNELMGLPPAVRRPWVVLASQ